MTFTKAERAALTIAQADIPHGPAPFADIARETGMEEEEVLELFRKLRQTGAIRRFGASIRHQKAGWRHNAMVAWTASREDADKAGEKAARHRHVSHAYFRPSPGPHWPYSFYTMVHGRTPEECEKVVEELAEAFGLTEYEILRSVRELKKTSMTYFTDGERNG